MFIETEQVMKENTIKNRQAFCDGIYKVLEDRRKIYDDMREAYITPEKVAANREAYRADFTNMLGWPLTDYENLGNTPMEVRVTPRYDIDWAKGYAMEFEVLPGLWAYALYFESKNEGELPFIIAQHGGCGNPEAAAETFEENNYNGMVRRAATYGGGANVLCPMLLMWPDRFEPAPKAIEDEGYSRSRIDARLKQVGSSITAVETFAIRRMLTYFIENGTAKEGHIGMLGLSYGGFYTTVTAAVDTRINAAYSSCQYSDRYRYGREDWIWGDNASRFLDAEVASLIAPRPFFADEGDRDDLFDFRAFLGECERTIPYFEAAGAKDSFKYRTFDGTHEFAKDDEGIAFIYNAIK
ncbi:MAG: hypothetical protein E7627_03730 [Ruminococcaceae bacterium]|nr:hypothetical protein [Oscillospiraceae bacterium]